MYGSGSSPTARPTIQTLPPAHLHSALDRNDGYPCQVGIGSSPRRHRRFRSVDAATPVNGSRPAAFSARCRFLRATASLSLSPQATSAHSERVRAKRKLSNSQSFLHGDAARRGRSRASRITPRSPSEVWSSGQAPMDVAGCTRGRLRLHSPSWRISSGGTALTPWQDDSRAATLRELVRSTRCGLRA